MKEKFVKFVRELREPVRAQRQEKIREVELAWSAGDFASFRLFALGLHSPEMMDICHALSDAQASPLLELLADFAEKNPNLINAAFDAMDKTSQEGRLYLAKRLVVSQNPEIRARTCIMLGRTGARGCAMLEKSLADPDTGVRVAALKAIVRGNFKSLASRVPDLLGDNEKEVRFAALETIARLGISNPNSEKSLLEILEDESQEAPARRLAAGILARESNGPARSILINALRSPSAPSALRMAAAESLSAYDDLEAIRTVIQAVYDSDQDIAQIAAMALNRKTSDNFENILAQILADDNQRLASYAAELLGGLDSEGAKNTLLERLKTERRIPVINAMASAMGKSSVPGAWDALIAKQKNEHIDDPAFFIALADVASEDNLTQYASFFDMTTKSKHAILNRLAYFALASPVTPEMRSLAIRVLNDPDKSLHIFAATILVHDANLKPEDITLVLTRMADLGNTPQIQGVVLALLRNRRGALADLFLDAPPESCAILTYAATQATGMGKNADALFCQVAQWVRKDVPGSREALRSMAVLAPGKLVAAMDKCEDQIFLIEAWRDLPEQDRAANRPNFRAFFADASPPDTLAAIHILKDIPEQRNLQVLADVAFSSKYPDARNAALTCTRELILAQ